MEMYEKRVKYLDYLEYGTKIKNGGFIKAEREGDICRVQISIRGLYPTDTLPGEIVLYGAEKGYRADKMTLQYGTGTYVAVWNAHNLAGGDISYEEWAGVEIIVSEHRRLRSVWQCPKATVTIRKVDADRPEETITMRKVEVDSPEETVTIRNVGADSREIQAAEVGETGLRTEPREEAWRESREMVQGENREKMQEEVGEEVYEECRKGVREESRNELGKEASEDVSSVKPPFAELYEDKWTQLEQYYKKIRPFGDRRSYLSITPGDFIVLGGKYQKLVSNSFLLHGYYNYGHVVLGRQSEGGSYRYYLGVPGIYHEREKQVARMFGFGGFEGAANPSSEGGFGYYMTPVEI